MEIKTKIHTALAIQGGLGSFHHIAARCFGVMDGDDLLPCTEFRTVAMHAAERANTAGVMAIENSLAGSLLRNYTLLDHYPVQVAGEVFLRIRQNLLALPGKSLDDLSEVHSHPMALAQCENFLHKHPHLKLVESDDTAMSAELIAKEGITQRAAIASSLAAELFGLEMLAPGIENNTQNYTRFLLIEKRDEQAAGRKASLSIVLDHSPGALHRLLGTAEKAGLNLTKIQSMPIVGTPWHYRFYIDVERESAMDAAWIKSNLSTSCAQLAILGVYAPGQQHEA